MATIPQLQGGLGVPATYTETLTVPYGGVLLGSSPLPVVDDGYLVDASQTIPAFTPVGLNGSGRVVPAVAGTTQAIGITTTDVVSPAGTTYIGIALLREGAVNYDVVNWPASYNTPALRFGAFRGAPTPTNIIVKRAAVGSL